MTFKELAVGEYFRWNFGAYVKRTDRTAYLIKSDQTVYIGPDYAVAVISPAQAARAVAGYATH